MLARRPGDASDIQEIAMTDIDTPTQELPDAQPPRSVNTTVPVDQAQDDIPNARHPAGKHQEPGDRDAMPHLPHERDQSVGMTDGNPSPKVQQAYKDLKRGLVDTDAGREAHNVGKPVVPPEPEAPGAPGPIEPDHK